MAITPDTKDWTWVLQRPCPECGFDTQGFPVAAVPGMIMANVAAWHARYFVHDQVHHLYDVTGQRAVQT